MRQFIFVLVFCSFSFFVIGQDLVLNSQTDVNNVDPNLTQVNDITISGSGISNLSPLFNLLEVNNININCRNLTTLDGLHNINTVLGSITIEDSHGLISLSAFQNLNEIGENLIINNCDGLFDINGLQNITSINGSLEIKHNFTLSNIDSLLSLSSLGGNLNLTANFNLVSIAGLQNLNTDALIDIRSNPILENVNGLELIKSLTGLYIVDNNLLTDLNALQGLKAVNELIIVNNNNLTKLEGLKNLEAVAFLTISDNDVLISLNGLGRINSDGLNPLTWYIRILNNPRLTDCCAIQTILAYLSSLNANIEIENNPMECSSINTILESDCEIKLLRGEIFYDEAGNGCDSLDLAYPNLELDIFNAQDTFRYILGTNKKYYIPVQDSVEYTIIPRVHNEQHFTVNPDTLIIFLPKDSAKLNQNFCVSAISPHTDLEVNIIPKSRARPGFEATYRLVYTNKGTTRQSGQIHLNFDSDKISFISASPTESTTINNTITWTYDNLRPFEQREIEITFLLNRPTDTPPLNAGDILSFLATIDPDPNETILLNNFAELRQQVVNSYDPNDKQCMEGNIISPDMIGDYVHYMIRFENTGNGEAINIKVIDTIDMTIYDPSTLEIVHSSHECITNIRAENIVEFEFNEIYLPFADSTNDGYVTFKIKTRADLSVGDDLANFADIYFDFNFPIRTNTAITKITVVAINNNSRLNTNYTFSPNPTSGNIIISDNVKTLDIYSVRGQLILRKNLDARIVDLSRLNKGIYIIKLYGSDGFNVGKLLKL